MLFFELWCNGLRTNVCKKRRKKATLRRLLVVCPVWHIHKQKTLQSPWYVAATMTDPLTASDAFNLLQLIARRANRKSGEEGEDTETAADSDPNQTLHDIFHDNATCDSAVNAVTKLDNATIIKKTVSEIGKPYNSIQALRDDMTQALSPHYQTLKAYMTGQGEMTGDLAAHLNNIGKRPTTTDTGDAKEEDEPETSHDVTMPVDSTRHDNATGVDMRQRSTVQEDNKAQESNKQTVWSADAFSKNPGTTPPKLKRKKQHSPRQSPKKSKNRNLPKAVHSWELPTFVNTKATDGKYSLPFIFAILPCRT